MNNRDDIPDLPRGFFWFEDRVTSAWHRRGTPVMQIRRRTLFGSRVVAQIAIPELIRNPDDNLARENAQHTLGKVMGL